MLAVVCYSTPLPSSSTTPPPANSKVHKSSPVGKPGQYHLSHKRDQIQAFADIKPESRLATAFLTSLNVPENQLLRLKRRSAPRLSNGNFITAVNNIAKSVKTRARYLFLCLAFLDDMVFHFRVK